MYRYASVSFTFCDTLLRNSFDSFPSSIKSFQCFLLRYSTFYPFIILYLFRILSPFTILHLVIPFLPLFQFTFHLPACDSCLSLWNWNTEYETKSLSEVLQTVSNTFLSDYSCTSYTIISTFDQFRCRMLVIRQALIELDLSSIFIFL